MKYILLNNLTLDDDMRTIPTSAETEIEAIEEAVEMHKENNINFTDAMLKRFTVDFMEWVKIKKKSNYFNFGFVQIVPFTTKRK